jgi:hypothetical protein
MIKKLLERLKKMISPVPIERDPTREQISPRVKPIEDPESHDIRGEVLIPPYYAKVIKELDFGKGYWGYLRVGVFARGKDGQPDAQIGEYTRNYSSLYRSFYPFERNGQWYALYSREYTATRVMTLPDCKDLCGESNESNGFCPVEFYVPQVCRHRENQGKYDFWYEYAPFGFVSGCAWGDDSSWKIEYLDLSKLSEKKLGHDARFGYIQLPTNVGLPDAIGEISDFDDECPDTDLSEHHVQFDIAVDITYRMWPDGTMHVFHTDEIAKSTRNYSGDKVGEIETLYFVDLGNKIKGAYPTKEMAERRLKYLEENRLKIGVLSGLNLSPKGIIEIVVQTTEDGYTNMITGKKYGDMKRWINEDGKTQFGNDDTCDLYDKDKVI